VPLFVDDAFHAEPSKLHKCKPADRRKWSDVARPSSLPRLNGSEMFPGAVLLHSEADTAKEWAQCRFDTATFCVKLRCCSRRLEMNLFRSLLVPLVVCAHMGALALPSDNAQKAHARGTCGSLGPGTGLLADKGWIVSMLPGPHALRVRGGGSAHLTAARMTHMDFDAGRPYYIVLEGTNPASVLEWKVPGKDWEPVAKTFLYPPQGVTYVKQ